MFWHLSSLKSLWDQYGFVIYLPATVNAIDIRKCVLVSTFAFPSSFGIRFDNSLHKIPGPWLEHFFLRRRDSSSLRPWCIVRVTKLNGADKIRKLLGTESS